ncbi:HXXEE domain-containing protein [Carboxydochorda subterranea]|uniref:HXXEE domain-containing protein n=1 Tax=Carboxydichorda subterranea TaxID=3109565 RepID=A0ABZ1BXH2_9FIRM|nr:HXXEE domain-containing protein [Limnochorda sp. L945t]WRP17408.1 HXXEE domain-containing protein [Limnochorda sp. L945t]
MGRVLALYLLAVAVQALHVLEEFRTGFHRAFPAALGFKPWSDEFFLTLNLVALSVFISSAAAWGVGWKPAVAVIWAFSVAMLGNGIVHPVLAVRRRAYFPGMYTALAHLALALLLLQALLQGETHPW